MRKLLLPAAVLLAASLPLLGTTIRRMELRELVKTASVIAEGTVQSVEVEFDPQRRLPFTRVTLRVRGNELLKPEGESRQIVYIRQLGGRYFDPEAGAYRTLIGPGAPGFQQGDDVIVFLREQADGTFQCVGMNQGKYEVTNEVAVSNLSGVEVLDPKTGQLTPGGFVEKMPVEVLKARIRELMR